MNNIILSDILTIKDSSSFRKWQTIKLLEDEFIITKIIDQTHIKIKQKNIFNLKNKKEWSMICNFEEVDQIIKNCINFYKKQKYWYFKNKDKIIFKILSKSVEVFQVKYCFSQDCFSYLKCELLKNDLYIQTNIIDWKYIFEINYLIKELWQE